MGKHSSSPPSGPRPVDKGQQHRGYALQIKWRNLSLNAYCIPGSKQSSVTVIYTPWSNLKKTAGMETGQVAFHKDSLVKRVRVPSKDKSVLARLNKTRQERNPDLAQERLQKDKRDRLTTKEYERKMVRPCPHCSHACSFKIERRCAGKRKETDRRRRLEELLQCLHRGKYGL